MPSPRSRQVRPNNPLELAAHSAGFLDHSWRFRLWAAAQRERSPDKNMPPTASEQNWRFVSGGGQFWANDVPKSIRWYSETLGFEVFREYQRDGHFVYVHLQREGARLLIFDRASLEDTGFAPSNLPAGGHDAVSIKVDGIDTLHNDLMKRIQECPPQLERRGSRREIRLIDPDGWVAVCWDWAQ
jgi:catechol 2,3-dioxygenase-like lactoylglutathione lyase family enzyme